MLPADRPPRFLIVKLSSLGDVVRGLPVACALRRRWPAAHIAWAVEEPTAPLLAGHPAIDELSVFPPFRWDEARPSWCAALARAVRRLRSTPFDVAIDLQGLLKSAFVSAASRSRARVGSGWQREGSKFISKGVGRAGDGPSHNAIDEYLAVAEYLGAPAEPLEFGLRVDEAARLSVARKLGRINGKRLLVVNPSCGRTGKEWPLARWAAVIEELSHDGVVALAGAPGRELDLSRQVRARLVDLRGATTLPELVALLDCCDLHLAADTGSGHVAAALGRPAVSLFGPTSPRRECPFGQERAVIEHRELCAPSCPQRCPSARRCLLAIMPGEVVQRAREVLEGRR